MTTKDTILIVEDSKSIVLLYKRALQKAGLNYKIEVAEDLETAKAKFASGTIAAVISDNDFPKAPKGSEKKPTFNDDSGIMLVHYIRHVLRETSLIVFATAGESTDTLYKISRAAGEYKLCRAVGVGHKLSDSKAIVPLDDLTSAINKTQDTPDIIAQHLAQKLPNIAAGHAI